MSEVEEDNDPQLNESPHVSGEENLNCGTEGGLKSSAGRERSSLEVCLKGVSKYHRDRQVEKELQQLLGDNMVKYETMTKPKMKPFCFLKFTNEADRDAFIKQIESIPAQKGKKMRIGEVHFSSRYAQQQAKASQNQQKQTFRVETQPIPTVVKQYTSEDVLNQTAQLRHMSYTDQVKYKMNSLAEMLGKFRQQYVLRLAEDDTAPKWIQNSEEDIYQLCNIEAPILCTEDLQYRYRNKTEFTIGYNHKGEPCVGFNVGSHSDGSASIERATNCVVTPPIALELGLFMEQLIQNSELKPFNRRNTEGSGFWRLLAVRRSERTNQIYLIVGVNKDGVEQELLESTINKMKEEMINKFHNHQYSLEGIMLVHSAKTGSEQPDSEKDVELLHGNTYYTEIILGKEFRVNDEFLQQISYNGFLQNHISQCDLLYQKVIEYTKTSKSFIYTQEPIFLDVCAGSGTIGINVADSVKEVIAIEMNQSSCKDAEFNYQNLKLTNCRMICAKVENVMKELSNDLKKNPSGSHFVACLDPPRAGAKVSNVVVEALRTCKGLDNIIYVSCCPPMIIENLLQLCLPTSKRRRAPGFKLKNICLVDMFPQTSHYETIFHLERDYS